jgi:RNA polymerase sigma-70 factor, ECF subfamily
MMKPLKAGSAGRERSTAAEQLATLAEVEITEAVEDVAADRLAALRACLERLPAHTRQLIHLRYVEECPGEEIAKRLGRPINTVYVTLCRLHKSLGDCVRTTLGQGT